ncbi:Curli production assembly/transport component CsgF [Rhodovastum atsumiense]|uniref:curli assembly protein CsgF n=1 Tax=Rhodovastum atsumiense TaxID=504468 RepID=UPI00139F2A87|nr:curli assembly protein CsgF [Rhodovastum atsumiense]CAH2603227.1 Curli production assembly/transport component CsgF [Rhodovastum atsumiense]
MTLACLAAMPAHATDLVYVLQSPSFGGSNDTALSRAQLEKSLVQSRDAAREAAAKAAAAAATSTTTTSPSQTFVNTVTAQITALVARSIADKIAGSKDGDAGTVVANGATITYVNADGQLNVTMTTAEGTTTLSIPTGQ